MSKYTGGNFMYTHKYAWTGGKQGNAGGGEKSIATRKARGTAHGGRQDSKPKEVGAAPTFGQDASFLRIAQGQCEEFVLYSVGPDSAVSEHFTPLCAEVLRNSKDIVLSGAPAAEVALLEAFVKYEHEVKWLHMGQLTKIPDHALDQALASRPSPPGTDKMYKPDGAWESWASTDEKSMYCQEPAPMGRYFKVNAPSYWENNTKILCMFAESPPIKINEDNEQVEGVDVPDYMFCVCQKRRGFQHVYFEGQPTQEMCVHLEIGELIQGDTPIFKAWGPGVMIRNELLRKKLFSIKSYPTHDDMKEEEEQVPVQAFREPQLTHLFQFETVGGVTCVAKARPKSQDEEGGIDWTPVANFELKSVEAIYMFRDRDAGVPSYKLKLMKPLSDTGTGTLVVSPDVPQSRTYSTFGYKQMVAYVFINTANMRYSTDIDEACKAVHSELQTSNFTPEMLRSWLVSEDMNQRFPPTQEVISYFGKQLGTDVYMAGNCAFKDGEFFTHKDVNMCIMHKHFKESVCPTPQSDYPMHIIIPQPWVRYTIGVRFFRYTLDGIFLNNTIAAKAVVAASVMGLYADRFWKSEHGQGHGMPFVWVMSRAHATGKTEASLCANSLLGFERRGLWAGDCTKSVFVARLHQQSDLMLVVDDVVLPKNSDHESKQWKDLGRLMFEGATRAVSNKLMKVLSSAIISVS
jgi:hypothetical protein